MDGKWRLAKLRFYLKKIRNNTLKLKISLHVAPHHYDVKQENGYSFWDMVKIIKLLVLDGQGKNCGNGQN